MPFDVVEALRDLGFRCPAASITAMLEEATKAKLSPLQVCERLAKLERRERDARNLARRTRTATLGPFSALDTFDWNHPRTVDRTLYEHLLGLDFIDAGENILLRGQSGVGKTTLAQNLAIAALNAGHHVRFCTLASALTDLLKQESLPALDRRLRRYVQPTLLVLDELGYLPCDSRSADLLYTILSRRHLVRPTVITTNLAFKEWGTVFPGAACVGALVDRFVERCHVIDIDADSWRQKRASTAPADRPRRKPT
jgi:DNA replication protein DnaC